MSSDPIKPAESDFDRISRLKREATEAYERTIKALENEAEAQLRRLAEQLNFDVIPRAPSRAPVPATQEATPALVAAVPPVSAPIPEPVPSIPALTPIAPSNDVWTLKRLAHAYQTDSRSPYAGLRFKTRESYDAHINRIIKDFGNERVSDLKSADILRFYNTWTKDSTMKFVISHARITMLRGLVHFGMKALALPECETLAMILHNTRFPMPKPRKVVLSKDEALAIIAKAHALDLHTVALAQAFQLDCGFSQKDCIGEWVPVSESGVSDVIDEKRNMKWMRGLRWEEIDENLVLRHKLSINDEVAELSLKEAPNVLAELERIGKLPKRGPMIINNLTEKPWVEWEFRQKWRLVARKCNIPDTVRNSDTPREPRGFSRKLRKSILASGLK